MPAAAPRSPRRCDFFENESGKVEGQLFRLVGDLVLSLKAHGDKDDEDDVDSGRNDDTARGSGGHGGRSNRSSRR